MVEQTRTLRSFVAVERFLTEIQGKDRRPGYVWRGDEGFLYERARAGVLDTLAPRDLRELCLHEVDLGELTIMDALDLAQTPSLMVPFQVIFVRSVKTLYGRGQKKEEFAAIEAYFRQPNPNALLIFVADHLHLPADLRRLDFAEREKADKIRETLGESCAVLELQSVSEEDAITWAQDEAERAGLTLGADAARELVDATGVNMLGVSSELEKVLLEAGARGATEVTVADVENMVPAAKQRTLYELTEALSLKDAPRAVALLGGLLNASDGEDAAIAHVFGLAKVFRQMLILNERQVKDQRAMWQVLWPGFRVAPFAADSLITQARRYRDRGELHEGLRAIARADAELRSNPPDKRLVLERLILRLAGRHPERQTRGA